MLVMSGFACTYTFGTVSSLLSKPAISVLPLRAVESVKAIGKPAEGPQST